MRVAWYKEGFVFTVLAFVVMFCFFDEEPLFDATDWNGIHVILLVLSIMVVIWENVSRARFGQFVYKDQVLTFATFSFWFFLENYFRVIVILFCFHTLTPLEADLIELVEVYQSLTRWLSVTILPAFLLMSLTLGMAVLLNLSIGWARWELHLLLVSTIILTLFVNLFFISWDLILAGLTSINWFCDVQAFYLQPKTSLTYDAILGVQDQFDWHKDRVHPFAMRFEDLFVFFLQLFNVLSLVFCLFVWLSLAIDLVQLGMFGVSYTYVGVATRWLEHVLINFSFGHIALFLTGLRVSLRTPIELWWLM